MVQEDVLPLFLPALDLSYDLRPLSAGIGRGLQPVPPTPLAWHEAPCSRRGGGYSPPAPGPMGQMPPLPPPAMFATLATFAKVATFPSFSERPQVGSIPPCSSAPRTKSPSTFAQGRVLSGERLGCGLIGGVRGRQASIADKGVAPPVSPEVQHLQHLQHLQPHPEGPAVSADSGHLLRHAADVAGNARLPPNASPSAHWKTGRG